MIVTALFFFWQKLSRDYFSNGYFYYYRVPIPEHTTAWQVSMKLKDDYKVSRHSQVRQRRKENGLAVCNFVIFRDMAIIVATEGEHETLKRRNFRDIRKKSLVIDGYELKPIALKKGGRLKISVFRTEKKFKEAKKTLEKIALHSPRKVEFHLRKFAPYTFEGMQNQRFELLKMVNVKRKKAGLKPIKWAETKPYWEKKKEHKTNS